ncbi:hypothetical protein PR048_004363 [Dryococelus australis]|uniref:Reverse transcriptase domain-containing protein n=1 Tax=Dryococelus australis TaxID=614101 RepID=A0ABQ9I592_9NEOP|nr:hypothetical protein PR048_004363 [Dryococelus australis]
MRPHKQLRLLDTPLHAFITCSAIFIDLFEVFDTVDHTIILKKVHTSGIRDLSFKLITSYLTNRSQYVKPSEAISVSNIRDKILRITNPDLRSGETAISIGTLRNWAAACPAPPPRELVRSEGVSCYPPPPPAPFLPQHLPRYANSKLHQECKQTTKFNFFSLTVSFVLRLAFKLRGARPRSLAPSPCVANEEYPRMCLTAAGVRYVVSVRRRIFESMQSRRGRLGSEPILTYQDPVTSVPYRVAPLKPKVFRSIVQELQKEDIVEPSDNSKLIMDPGKIRLVANLPVPKNLRGVRRFLGMVVFYSICIPNFANIAEPLNNLKRKGKEVLAAIYGMEKFSDLLESAEFVLHTSNQALSWCLSTNKPAAGRLARRHPERVMVTLKEVRIYQTSNMCHTLTPQPSALPPDSPYSFYWSTFSLLVWVCSVVEVLLQYRHGGRDVEESVGPDSMFLTVSQTLPDHTRAAQVDSDLLPGNDIKTLITSMPRRVGPGGANKLDGDALRRLSINVSQRHETQLRYIMLRERTCLANLMKGRRKGRVLAFVLSLQGRRDLSDRLGRDPLRLRNTCSCLDCRGKYKKLSKLLRVAPPFALMTAGDDGGATCTPQCTGSGQAPCETCLEQNPRRAYLFADSVPPGVFDRTERARLRIQVCGVSIRPLGNGLRVARLVPWVQLAGEGRQHVYQGAYYIRKRLGLGVFGTRSFILRDYVYVDALGRLDVHFTFPAPLNSIIWGGGGFGAVIPNCIPRCYHRIFWIAFHYGCKFKDVSTSKVLVQVYHQQRSKLYSVDMTAPSLHVLGEALTPCQRRVPMCSSTRPSRRAFSTRRLLYSGSEEMVSGWHGCSRASTELTECDAALWPVYLRLPTELAGTELAECDDALWPVYPRLPTEGQH